MSGPDGAAPAYAVLAVGHRPERYRINEEAFDEWCDALGEELRSEIPALLFHEQPALRLSSFADDAMCNHVIEQVAGLRLDVYGEDSYNDNGFYVMLSNTAGGQQHVFLTSGWNEMSSVVEGTDPREAARDYLETICDLANAVIDGLYPHRVAGAEAANLVTIELSEGSCSTWLLTDQRADVVAEAITARCGPPDSQIC